jgi:hypothetical protein
VSNEPVPCLPTKPLGHKSYGSIGHLPGSRMDSQHKKYATGKMAGKDFGVHIGQARVCTQQVRDKRDVVLVQEKLDGSNVSIANIDGTLVPLSRSGYPCNTSKYEQHFMFAAWVFERYDSFDFIRPGERLCGEWLAQAHGTRYDLSPDTLRQPFVAFDIMRNGHERATYQELLDRLCWRFAAPALLGQGPMTVEEAIRRLGDRGHYGALDAPEGAVWRVERDGKVDFLAKYVRPDKVDGSFLPEVSGQPAVWNWPSSR